MGIVRVDKKKNFAVMDKTGLEDPSLSFKAKGYICCVTKRSY